MERIPVRELNQHTSAVLSLVQQGQSVEVTLNGRLIARIVPATPTPLDDLIRRGRVVPATSSGPIPLPPGEPDLTTDSTEIISELRAERL